MKNILILFVFLFAISSYAQASKDSIIVKNSFLGHKYIIGDNKITHNTVSDILDANPSSHALMHQSQGKMILGTVFLAGGLVSSVFVIKDALKSKKDTGRLPSTHSFAYATVITAGVLVIGAVSITDANWKFHFINKSNIFARKYV
jgi:hypothetical protein